MGSYYTGKAHREPNQITDWSAESHYEVATVQRKNLKLIIVTIY